MLGSNWVYLSSKYKNMKIYKKGDLYFKTYYQYERVLETYDRHSLQYNFFIELGSLKRKDQYMSEQYNIKTGS